MKRISLSIIIVGICTAAFAQDNDTILTQTVNIEKEYIPQVVKTKRADIELPTAEPKIEKSKVAYDSETTPMEVESQFYPLPAAAAKNTGRPKYKPGCARIGLGFPLVWAADVWTPVVNNSTDFLGMQMNHNGFWNGTKKLIQTDFDLNYKHNTKYGQLYSLIGFDNEYYSYYGTDSVFEKSVYYLRDDVKRDVAGVGLLPQMRTTTKAHALIGFGSENERKGWTYNGNIAYEIMTSSPSITKSGIKIKHDATREHRIGLNLYGGYNLNGHHINADLNVAAYLYNNPAQTVYLIDSVISATERTLRDTTFVNHNRKPQFLVTFNPRYEKTWGNLALRAGAKMWFSVNKGNVVAAAPDINVRYTFRQLFDIYGGIGGDYTFTSMADILRENRYYDLDSRPSQNDYTPFDFYFGFDLKPAHGLRFGASINYKMMQNTHFFANRTYECTETPNVYPKEDLEWVYGNTFTIENAKARLLTAEAHLSYNLHERYIFHVQGRYNGWDVKTEGIEAWNKPKWEADAGIEAMFTKNFAANINFHYASERTTPLPNRDGSRAIATLAPIYDLNMSFSYTFPKNITIFAQANNLLALSDNLRYQLWYGYDNIGAHILAGVSVSF